MLILVRHAMPAYSEDVPADEWPLSPDGFSAARQLTLPAGALLAASNEVKAWQTLEHAGPVIRDPRFRELSRVEAWDGPFRELRRSYVDGAALAGWESHEAVAARFDNGVAELVVRSGSRPLVIASHGMAMTVWLRSRGCITEPGEFWAALRFPDCVAVDLDARTAAVLD
jgi:broad specificity phosphatase PhoE